MRMYDVIRRAGRSLKQAKIRTILTSLAIAVGAFTITLSLAAGEGGRTYAEKLIAANADTQSLMVTPHFENRNQGDTDTPREINAAQANTDQSTPSLSQADIDKIAAISGVESVVPIYGLQAQYMTRGEGAKKYQASLDTYLPGAPITLTAGTLPNNTLQDRQIVLPEKYLEVLELGSAQQAVGKTVTLHFARPPLNAGQLPVSQDEVYTIAAVDKEPENALLYQPAIRLSTSESKRLYDVMTLGGDLHGKFYALSTTVAKTADVKTVQDQVKTMGYDVLSARDIQATLFQFIDLLQWGTAGFGALAILASIFGIINTQYISVLERTQQIGLMKALGMRSRDVASLFRYEAAWIGFLGGAIGTGLALLAGTTLNPVITDALKLSPGTTLLIFQPLVIIALIASLILIAIIAGYFPARKAAKLDPIEALRTE